MTSLLGRYGRHLSKTMASWFPRTTSFLKEEAGKPAPSPAAGSHKGGSKKSMAADRSATAANMTTADENTKGIYSSGFTISRRQEQEMRSTVNRAVAAGLLRQPSAEQWQMILARAPTTRIFAGAGSGKSTTLVLRIVFMLCHLGVAREEMTVVSFTKASCEALRQQLIEVLAFWGKPLGEQEARRLVRTFHSALAQLTKASLGPLDWFEQLTAQGLQASDDAEKDPLGTVALNAAQRDVLLEAYERCYSEEPEFRRRLGILLEIGAEEMETLTNAPLHPFLLSGERIPLPLPDAFFAQGTFAENLGLRVGAIKTRPLPCSGRDKIFLEALQQFWRHLEKVLREHGLITFNMAFGILSEKLKKAPSKRLANQLLPFRHLLIDEFQDISPRIAIWLQRIHQQCAGPGQPPSLMAIGDDWQSIYLWRGSSPELFMAFDHWFPCATAQAKSQALMLGANYRSGPQIVTDAEKVLTLVRHKQAKQTRAVRAADPEGHGVKVVSGFDLGRHLPRLVEDIEVQRSYALQRPSPERCAVLIISRANAALQQIQAQLGKREGVRSCTIHRAKGLQAEVAIILDDGQPQTTHPLRNALYQASGHFTQTYDDAMADEALRLSYVAVTRGVSRVIWYTRNARGVPALFV